MTNDSISHTSVMRSPQKPLNNWESIWGGEHIKVLAQCYARAWRSTPAPNFAPNNPSLWLFLSLILYNQQGTANRMPSRILQDFLATIKPEKGIVVAQMDRE